MNKIKVLIVDDSAFMRRILTDILQKDHRIVVIGTARDGEDCLARIAHLKPDVVTMDVEMPKMNGLEALETIMSKVPTPVVMVSSITKEGADSTIKAITLGAVDFIEKPSGPISLDIGKIEGKIIRKIIAASKANVSVHRIPSVKSELLSRSYRYHIDKRFSIIAIGTSTGGPRALDHVITELPGDLPAPVVIVQHMPKGFTRSLAQRLNKRAAIHVKEAEHGENVQKGTAYIAPGGFHMTIEQKKEKFHIVLDESPAIHGHRPAVNRLFSSLSHLQHVHIITAVMTGMGADGTKGLFELKQRKPDSYSIAEAEETCVVFGMPKSVIKSGLADEIVPVFMISESVVKVLGK